MCWRSGLYEQGFTVGNVSRELKTKRTAWVVSGEQRAGPLSLKIKDMKWEGRDVRSCSQIQKDGLKSIVWKHESVLWWRVVMRRLAWAFELLLGVNSEPQTFSQMPNKMRFVFKKDCSDLLIFGDSNQSVSKFMCDTLCILLGSIYMVRPRNCTWFFSLVYVLSFCSLGKKNIYYLFLFV